MILQWREFRGVDPGIFQKGLSQGPGTQIPNGLQGQIPGRGWGEKSQKLKQNVKNVEKNLKCNEYGEKIQ